MKVDYSNTVHICFANHAVRAIRIPYRIRRMSSVVVEDDVPTVVGTRYFDRIRYCSSGIHRVFKTQNAIFRFVVLDRYTETPKKFLVNRLSLSKTIQTKILYFLTNRNDCMAVCERINFGLILFSSMDNTFTM